MYAEKRRKNRETKGKSEVRAEEGVISELRGGSHDFVHVKEEGGKPIGEIAQESRWQRAKKHPNLLWKVLVVAFLVPNQPHEVSDGFLLVFPEFAQAGEEEGVNSLAPGVSDNLRMAGFQG